MYSYTFKLVDNSIHVTRKSKPLRTDPKTGKFHDRDIADDWTSKWMAFKEDHPTAKPTQIIFSCVKDLHEEMDQILTFAREMASIDKIVILGLDDEWINHFNDQTQHGRRIEFLNSIPGSTPFADGVGLPRMQVKTSYYPA